MSRTARFLTTHGLDLLIVATAVATGVSTAARDDLDHPGGALLWVETLAITAAVLTLLGRRRFPFAAPASTWLASASLSFLDGELIVDQAGIFIAGMGAAVLLGSQRSARQSAIGLVVVAVSAEAIVYHGEGSTAGDLVSIPVLFSIGWLVGFGLRERTQRTEVAEERARRAEQERESAARLAVAEERSRIARELHDIVAHAVSMMLLQVGAVRHRLPDGATEDREALQNVERAGRTALTEMRRLLGSMREEGLPPELAPHPGLADLDRLAEDVRSAGLPVRLHTLGRRTTLPPVLDLTAYRILQEALTNSLKHSGATGVDATVEFAPGELHLEVRDDGTRGPRRGDANGLGLGHGLIGIRERVKVFGGEMSAGPASGGGFVVSARIPLGSDEP